MADSPDEEDRDWFGTGEPTEASGIVGEYLALSREVEADVLAMQMGDFYEFFGEDAELVGEELDLQVSQRSSGGESYAMAGVPVDDLAPYLKALVERGYRVAVADQHEVADGHERRIDRVVTPGTLLDPTGDDAQYLATLVRGDGGPDATVGLAFLDVTTGRFQATAVSGPSAEARALTECYRFAPTEVLPGPDARNNDALLERLRESLGAHGGETRFTLHDAEAFAPGRAKHTLREQFGDATADSVVSLTSGRIPSPLSRRGRTALSIHRYERLWVMRPPLRGAPWRSDNEPKDVGTTHYCNRPVVSVGSSRMREPRCTHPTPHLSTR
ncbi:hypothetical protein BRC89_11310, partial [Halobacteriales archaeon QS_4_70_19]